jgi:hypothetical protein
VQKYPHVDTFYDQGRVEVITSVQRRRRWSWVEKERIVAAALEPGAVASEVPCGGGSHQTWRPPSAPPRLARHPLPDPRAEAQAGSNSAPRSEDWPNRSCRRLRIAYLSFSIKIARYCAALSAALRAARSPKSQNATLVCAGNGAVIQNVAISQCRHAVHRGIAHPGLQRLVPGKLGFCRTGRFNCYRTARRRNPTHLSQRLRVFQARRFRFRKGGEAMTIKRLTAARAVRFKRLIGNRSNRSSGNSYARAPKFSLNRPTGSLPQPD